MIKVLSRIRKYRPWASTREIPLTALALIFFISSIYLVSLANAYSDRINKYQHLPLDQRFRLPDPILDTLNPLYKKLSIPKSFPDTLVHMTPFFVLGRALIGGTKSFLILRRAGYLLGLGYLIRIVFILMTLLPNADLQCEMDISSSILYDAWLLMFQNKISCGDVVFSGHTVTFMSASLVWVQNPIGRINRRAQQVVNFLAILFGFVGVTSLVASTYHYTLDCTISVCFMLFVWKFYYFAVTTNYLNGTFIGELIHYIDGTKYHTKFELPVHSITTNTTRDYQVSYEVEPLLQSPL